MATRRLWLTLYMAVTMAAGAVGLGLCLERWGALPLSPWELALFIGLAGVLEAMAVPVAGGGAVAASFAVLFAGLLVLGSAATAWVAALAVVWSEALVRRRSLGRAGFNAGHSVLSLLAVGGVYGMLGGRVGHLDLRSQWPAVLGAAIALWTLETGWVSLAVALERGGRLRRRLRSHLGPALIWNGALASVGLLLALLYQSRAELVGHSGWQGMLVLGAAVLVPCGLLYYAYRLQSDLQAVYSQSLQTLGGLMEAKVEGGQPGHGEQVAKLAASLAEALELPPDQVEQIRYAGYLHDIGKVGVPSSLLNRSRDRFEGEPEALREHPKYGAQILQPIRFLRPAAEIVQNHHERWDGLGYPRGLRADQIPLGARLLALANAYVGMTHSPHAPLTPDRALSRLRQAAGSRFDPGLIVELAAVVLVSRSAASPSSERPKLKLLGG
jgi:putative nucleotidyltransferase with HDIG domain